MEIVMSEYFEKLKDPKWQQLRLKIFERDNWACVSCHSKDQTLHAHHTYYKSNADPWDYDLDTLVTLCHECHTEEHNGLSMAKQELFKTLGKLNYWNINSLYYVIWFLKEYLPRGEK
jgi:hypothetical protein